MDDKIHIAAVDSEGWFYCRAVGSRLNYKKNQQVCGCGCPCFVKSEGGSFVCRYEGEEEDLSLFPRVSGLDERLYKAYSYSAAAHKGQFRKGSQIPYFSHIITTMNYMMELTDDIELQMAAILHDTVEDTSVMLKDIEQEFGSRVAFFVAAQTEDKRRGVPAADTWEIRKREAIERIRDMPHDAKMITLSDKTANAESLVREIVYYGDAIWERFNQKDKRRQEWYFRECAKVMTEFHDTSVMKKYLEYIELLFGK